MRVERCDQTVARKRLGFFFFFCALKVVPTSILEIYIKRLYPSRVLISAPQYTEGIFHTRILICKMVLFFISQKVFIDISTQYTYSHLHIGYKDYSNV